MDDDGYFDERCAAIYDHDAAAFDPDAIRPVVDVLAKLAEGGRVLEFGIGTGRIALPLTQRGLSVDGIDMSKAMVARLRSKPGGKAIDVTIGDFATTSKERLYSVVYLIFNTINNLTSQAAQVACFKNAAAHLLPGGYFVIEVGVPALQRLPLGENMLVFHRSETHLGIDEYDVVTQGFTSHHLTIAGDQVERRSIPFRYVWPSELDLMAEMAGMTLQGRWGGWSEEPFTKTSSSHVSVWRKPRP